MVNGSPHFGWHHFGAHSWSPAGIPLADHRRIPRGWYCRLPDGHVGPCPAWPTRLTRIRYRLRGYRMLDDGTFSRRQFARRVADGNRGR